MKYYLDITLLSDAEVNLGFLWQKVYQQVHLALVEGKTSDRTSEVAVSFPEYGHKQFPLGAKLRLIADTETKLQQLDIGKWLNRLTDYTHFKSIKEVPSSVNQFAYFKRKQLDTNIERMARRRVKRKGETIEQAMDHLSGFIDKESNLPFINTKSLSENKTFKLFIEKVVVEQPKTGLFTCYGLSQQQVTVPWF
jgi:CRISPR-associated endonuclease Csy4